MNVELQILKQLARDAQSTTRVIDEYCLEYKDIFKEVRSYECFKYLFTYRNNFQDREKIIARNR